MRDIHRRLRSVERRTGATPDPMARRVDVPANAAAPGDVGDWSVDTDFFYVCVATDTWMRATLSTW